MTDTNGKTWVMRLPRGVREQPGWVFIGLMSTVTGISYLTGLASSASITSILNPVFVRAWGGFLLLAGVLVAVSTAISNRPLERLSLRLLSLGIIIYLGWILTVVPLSRSMVVLTLGASLAGLCEVRIAFLKSKMTKIPKRYRDGA